MIRDIALRLDLRRSQRGWRGVCPACGYRDAFSLRERDGRVGGWCASCGDRGVIDGLIAAMTEGRSPAMAEPSSGVPKVSDAERTARALKAWNGAVPAAGTPAQTYLISRGLPDLAQKRSLRWRPDIAHPEVEGRHPGMLVLIQDVQGQPQAIHRHYLTREGHKAALDPPKASSGPVRGGMVQLDEIGPEMVVGEGVESSASAGILFSLPALAAISAGNLEYSLDLPPEVRSVLIAADHDRVAPNGRRPGAWAAHAAARRWQAQGRRVRIALPDAEGADFNDVLQGRLGIVHG